MIKKSPTQKILFSVILSSLVLSGLLGVVAAFEENGEDTMPPLSMTTYFTNTNQANNRVECILDDEEDVKKAYLNYDDVVGHGNSEDKYSPIIDIDTRLDDLASTNAFCDDISCLDGDLIELWHTQTYNNLAEGWHILSARAEDSANNEEQFSDSNTCEFCIDTQDPAKPSTPTLSRNIFCDPNYINTIEDDIIFSWTASDNGCAGVSFFDVFVEIDFDNDGIAVETITIEGLGESSINLENVLVEEEIELEDGDAVRIQVVAHDKAGNEGEVSEWSNWIIVDNTVPEVTITNTNADEWVMGDLVITEIDEDENLFKCLYKVNVVNGETTIDWTEVECNMPFTINTIDACIIDGKNICRVSKKAQDKACNENEPRSMKFDIDNNAPTLEKEVVRGPSHTDEESGNNFVSTSTFFEIMANDEGSGVSQLCYQINTNEPVCFNGENGILLETIEEEDSIRIITMGTTEFNFQEESQHTLTFWATDNKGMRAEMTQTHFVDLTPPTTTKSYSILFIEIKDWITETFTIEDFTFDWIGANTEITLEAQDNQPHPSGLRKTLFKIFHPSEDEDSHVEWYGLNTERWYDDEEMCSMQNCPLEESRCEGIPEQRACADYATQEQCSAVGCTWTTTEMFSCQGIALGGIPCSAMVNQNDCALDLGCTWQSQTTNSCEGTPEEITCDRLDSVQCTETLGCNWIVDDQNEPCENCIMTLWEDEEEWQTYESPITIEDQGAHKICFFSVDNVENDEEQMCQVFFVDSTAPEIQIQNPTLEEAANVEKCVQSIVALVHDDKTGVKRVWAELWENSEDENEDKKVKEVELIFREEQGYYEALMDKQLPSGSYTLRIMAEDNVGNVQTVDIEEQLVSTVFVEFISPATCSINPAAGGQCDFTFHVCMRDANHISFWLDKIGGVITPSMMNAQISDNGEEVFVGLSDGTWFSNAGTLQLDEEIINGRTSFDLSLDIPADVAGSIGRGSHRLEYWIDSFVEPEEVESED